jgi:short-subunit dehydrogenase
MKAAETRALVTGATGGIGAVIVEKLLARGASVLATGRNTAALAELSRRCAQFGGRVSFVAADLVQPGDRARLCAAAIAGNGGAGVNVLINGAGIGRFGLFEATPDDEIERLLAINVAAPLQLTRALLPHLQRQPAAAIVNIGSVLGTIGYPGQTVYSVTKFAIRGFSEALRRELADSSVRVLHVAPRATRTPLNSAAVDRLNRALRVAIDSPVVVADAVCRALDDERKTSVLGWPERLYARVNAVSPSIVDRSLRATLPVIKAHAADAVGDVTGCERTATSMW